MNPLIACIWAAGVMHLIIVAANLLAPRRLHYRENLAKVSTIVRQIFIVHSVYILLVLLIFSGLCFFFARELAGGSQLGSFLSGCMAVFWLLRAAIQVFYYDPELKRRHKVIHMGFTVTILYMGIVFALAAFGVGV